MEGEGEEREKHSSKRKRELFAQLRKKLGQCDDSSNTETDEDSSSRKKTAFGNKNAMKEKRAIEIGWVHEGHQVRVKTGGGTRRVLMDRNSTYQDILEEASNLFFPRGTSKKGIKLEEVNVDLCDFSLNRFPASQTVAETYEKEKLSGILRWYISSKNKESAHISGDKRVKKDIPEKVANTSSNPTNDNLGQPGTSEDQDSTDKQCSVDYFAELHCSMDDSSIDHGTVQDAEVQATSHDSYKAGLYPVLNGNVCLSREPICIVYTKQVKSIYSGKTSTVTASSRSQCLYKPLDDDGNPLTTDDDIDPLQHGYSVGEISKGNICFVELHASNDGNNDEQQYRFPSKSTADDHLLILHHPDEVWGYEDGKLVLAVVAHHHNNVGVTFKWFCDGQSLYSGGCIYVVDKPGFYHCELTANVQDIDGEVRAIAEVSNQVQVVQLCAPVETVPIKKNQESSTPLRIESAQLSCDYKEPIAQGSFGEVFKGAYQYESVAVKRIKLRKGKRPEKQILKEAQIHQQLAHKNIVKFIGICLEPSFISIITEFIDGQNMEEKIYNAEGENCMDWDRKLAVATGVVEGVSYLHNHNPQIIHQDIKPANILLDENLVPRLCDLGCARMKSCGAASTTSGIHVFGTPEYMAPETLLYSQKSTSSSDIWSLGITLIEWFGQRDPWILQEQDEDPLTVIKSCMMSKQKPPLAETFNFPLIISCLSYPPQNRPAAAHLLKHLQCPSCSKNIAL